MSAATITAWPIRLCLASHLLFFFALFLWFSPLTHALCVESDKAIFYLLNGSLSHNPVWQSVWAMLNHRRETGYNLILACCFNLWAIYQSKNPRLRIHTIKCFIYFWICFEFFFCLHEYFFHAFLKVGRYSPSLVLTPSLRLSTLLNDPNIKDTSQNCFPGGHAFALLYWALFSLYLSPRLIGILGMIFALFLCLPRLFSGAHWMSDTLFSALLAMVCFVWTLMLLRSIKSLNI
jgi:membrane-associated phospholipid phosphatase